MRGVFVAALVLSALGFAATGRADLDVVVGNGVRVAGRIAPAQETETFAFDLPRGSVLSVALKGGKGRGAAPARLQFLDPNYAEVAAQRIAVAGTGAKLSKFAIEMTGTHRVVVRGDGAREVDYQLTIGWKDATSIKLPADLPDSGLTTTLSLDAGSTLAITVKRGRGSTALPRLVSLTPRNGGDPITFPPPAVATSTSHKVTGIVVTATGDYDLSISADGGVAGAITGAVSVRPPKPVKMSLSLGGDALSGLPLEIARPLVGVVGPAGGALAVDSPLERVSGAGVSFPAGALGSPATVVISAAANVTAATNGTTGTGPSVFFGPEGLKFKKPATLTIPFDPSRFAGDFTSLSVVVRDAAGALSVVPGPYSIDAARGTVSFPASHFSSYRAFGSPPPSSSDLDGDGFDDAVYAAPADGAGRVRVRFGNAVRDFSGGRTVDLVGSQPGERFGFALATGDVNGDGVADLCVGAPVASPSGQVLVYFGGSAFETKTTADAVLANSSSPGNFGTSVAVADVTGDGTGDLIVGDPLGVVVSQFGAAHVFPGSATFTNASTGDPGVLTFTGDAVGDRFGAAVAAGRVDGDATADLVVSAPRELQGGLGRVLVFHGGSGLASQAAANASVTFTASEADDAFGAAIAVGDTSGDGIDDVVVGAPRNDAGNTDVGIVVVFNGSATLASATASQASRVITQFPAPNRQFGRSIRVGDVMGDRTLDIVAGAPLAQHAAFLEAGMSMVLIGGPYTDGFYGIQVFGDDRPGDHFGVMLGVIDFDADGLGDMLIARPGPGPNLDGGGRVDLFFGPHVFGLLQAFDVGSPGQHLGGEPASDGLAH